MPTQLAFHFWPDWALVFGVRVDYLAPAIYLTDVLIVLLLGFWFLGKPKARITGQAVSWTIYLAVFVVLNLYLSTSWQVTLFRWLKVLEFGFLGFYISQNWDRVKTVFSSTLALTAIYSLVIAIIQIIKAGTIGGPLYLLGERSFNSETPGIALVFLWGQKLLRPYATFPHPNVLAGFFLVTLIFLISNPKKSLLVKVGIVCSAILVVISFSQGVLIAGLFLIIFKIFKLERFKLRLLTLLFVFSVFMPTFSAQVLGVSASYTQSVAQRLQLAATAGKVISEKFFLGSGLGTFVVNGDNRLLQPVHNIILLVFAETGIVGVVLFFLLLHKCLEIRNWKLEIALLAILLTGMVDHYWVTLQQSSLLFAILLGYGLHSLLRRGRAG